MYLYICINGNVLTYVCIYTSKSECMYEYVYIYIWYDIVSL